MKKNVLRIFLIVLAILVILFIINLIRNYTIIAKICSSEESSKQSLENYHFEQTLEYYAESKIESRTEIYALDGIYVCKNYLNGNLYTTIYINTFTGEKLTSENGTITSNDVDMQVEDTYKEMFLTGNNSKNDIIKKVLLNHLFTPIVKKDNQYVIKIDEFTAYINVNTNLMKKWVHKDTTATFKIEKDVVTNDQVEKTSIVQE